MAAVLEGVQIDARGTVVHQSALAQLQAYLDSLSPSQLIGMWLAGVALLRDTLQDPETSMYAALFLMPFLAFVLRALRKKGE